MRNRHLTREQEVVRKVIPLLSFAKKTKVKDYLLQCGIDLKRDSYKCVICGREIVTYEDVGVLITNKSGHVFVCSNPSCMAKADLVTIYEHIKRLMETSK